MRKRVFLTAFALVLAGASAPTDVTDAIPHFALSKSAPEADATVPAVSEVRLWFTEEPSEGTVSIRLLDASEHPVASGDAVQSEEDVRSFAVSPDAPLAPGSYTVSWRGMGSDGHVVRDTLSFTVGG